MPRLFPTAVHRIQWVRQTGLAAGVSSALALGIAGVAGSGDCMALDDLSGSVPPRLADTPQAGVQEPIGLPALQLARVYPGGIDVLEYWVSEKLDGVRAYWDGSRLLSRNGNRFHAPSWFTQGFPRRALDGELWMGRNSFEQLMSTVRDRVPDEVAWRQVRFRVFDLPASKLSFGRRHAELQALSGSQDRPFLQVVPQYRIGSEAELQEKLAQVVAAGGEGLMLHRDSALYTAGRTSGLLKLKPYQDAEARVLAHMPGRGKYRGMLGALLVQMPDGHRFKIGTGFTDAQRRDPPPVGSRITYKYHGKTRKGLPRFASFLRVRNVSEMER